MRIIRTFLLATMLIATGAPFATAKTSVAKPGLQHMSDLEIESLIKTKLAKSKMAHEGLTIHVKNHVATWEGKTDIVQHKGAATRMARTAGAAQVVNNIRISEAARKRAADQLAKRWNQGEPVKKASLVN